MNEEQVTKNSGRQPLFLVLWSKSTKINNKKGMHKDEPMPNLMNVSAWA